MKDTQDTSLTDARVGTGNECREAVGCCNGNRGEFCAGAGECRPTLVRGRRLLLTAAVALFVSVSLAACSGAFFSGPTLSSMYVTPSSPTVAMNSTSQLAAYGLYSDGNQSRVSGDKISWSSSDPTIATVTTPGGLVTGVSIGTATITASTIETIPSSGCSVELAGGSITKTCRGASSETVTAMATVNVTE